MEAGSHTRSPDRSGLNGLAIAATNHCLTGCAIGEVAGMALATAFGWGNVTQMSLAIVFAYFFGFLLVASALGAGLGDPLFYGSLAAGFAVAYPFAFWANRWQIARGRGHALMHEQHAH
jgi:4-amino-4-deoxy-L-arabinose transferase-like glycosyltransferase